jgi:predicted alpha/beta-fold hydrolase
MYLHIFKRPELYTSNKECQRLLNNCPSLNKPYVPSFLFGWNKHAQIILYTIKDFFQKLFYRPTWISEKIILEDGEEVSLDWAFSNNLDLAFSNNLDLEFSNNLAFSNHKSPILMIHPGALGNRRTLMGQWVKKAHARGWDVCVHNRRGHDKLLTLPKWQFFGSVQDVQYITTRHILKNRPNAILLMLGLSAGSGLTLKYFGKHIEYAAGVCISPGIGIQKSMGRAQFPYNKCVVSGMKTFLQKNENVLKNITGYKECMNAKNPQEFHDNSWAMAGYSSQAEYYNNEYSMNFFTNIKNPLLMINSKDDPIAVKQNILDWKHLSNYKDHKGIFVLANFGSHCAFLEKFMGSWSEKVTFEFFDAVVNENMKK